MKWSTAWYNLISQHSLSLFRVQSSPFTESTIKIYWSSDQRASISLHSSPNHSLTIFTSTASDLTTSVTLSLSLIAISYRSSHSQRLKVTFSASLSFSISDSQSQILKTWNHFTKSPSLTRMLSASHSLISTVPSGLHQFHTKSQDSNLHQSSIFTF